MFDAIVLSSAAPEPAARTLAGLVEGVVESLLGRVLLVSDASGRDLEVLADASGCRLETDVAPERLPAIVAVHCHSPHVLAFRAGAVLPPGWPALLNQEFHHRGVLGPSETLAFRPDALGARLRLAGAAVARRPIPLDFGVLAPRAALTDRRFHGISLRPPGRVRQAALPVRRFD